MYNNFNENFNTDEIIRLETKLNEHHVYQSVRTREDLNVFMRHHIFSVWDFMSLLKFLQFHIAPAVFPWFPATRHTNARRFINAIVLEEESDEKESGRGYISHFEMYLNAMKELDIKTDEIEKFSDITVCSGIDRALESAPMPEAARFFVSKTFEFIKSNKAHIGAAAFAYGREKIIPDMFRRIIEDSGLKPVDAPSFFHYLERHIHLDEDYHAPLSMMMLEELCEGKIEKIKEAQTAAEEAIKARIQFWDGVASEVKRKSSYASARA